MLWRFVLIDASGFGLSCWAERSMEHRDARHILKSIELLEGGVRDGKSYGYGLRFGNICRGGFQEGYGVVPRDEPM